MTMDLHVSGQYRSIAKEQEKIKKMVEKIDRKFVLLEKQLKHSDDIKVARRQVNKKDLISQEDLFNELGL